MISYFNRLKQNSILFRKIFKKNIFIFIFLFLLALLCRLPFFFQAVIDWDESTFILVGQSILDGHLPYTKLWELKPPLAFVFYALAIFCFGKSIVAVRFAGALWVACTAFLVTITGQAIGNRRTGIIAAIIFILLSALFPAGQAIMTEHIAILPLIAALSWLVTQKTTPRNLFWAGTLIGTASMVRLNIAYVALLVGCFAYYLLSGGISFLDRKKLVGYFGVFF